MSTKVPKSEKEFADKAGYVPFTCDKIQKRRDCRPILTEDEDIRTNIHSHWRVHPLLKTVESVDHPDWDLRLPGFYPRKAPMSRSLIFRNIPGLAGISNSGSAMSVTMLVSNNALKKLLLGARKNPLHWVEQYAVLVL